MNRREFLIASAGLAVTAAAQDSVLGSNERFNVALIGCGDQGTHLLTKLLKYPAAKVIGVCDIYKRRLEKAAALSGAAAYNDYRKVLDLKDVDAVFIATPDHWHAHMAIDAMDAGKDVYLEKPMARYWHEAKQLHRAWLRTRRVVQVGSQYCSRALWRQARDLVAAGRIGKLVWSQLSYSRNSRDGDWTIPIDLDAGPHNIDWDAFLGPAPRRPFDPERYFRWRKYWDYAGGMCTLLYPHMIYQMLIVLGQEFPIRVVSSGCFAVANDRETPDTIHALVEFPSRHNLVITGSQANEQGLPFVVRGHEATMYLSSHQIAIRPERVFAQKAKEETFDVTDKSDETLAHFDDFFNAVRRRDPRTLCDVNLCYRGTVIQDMMIESYRRDKVMRFDPAREEMIA
jgi:predicted dehydrogenase